ncbi:hypothetical protein K5N54_004142 [Vibrio vulnificus]|nr:hypothetical protein [Vibrio vulnificus]EHZ2765063.1 hypothetical protein [Vibrio vulnificus]
MSFSILGVFFVGFFCFLMGRDYNPTPFIFSFSDLGNAIVSAWAVVGCMTFIFNWASVG